MQSRPRRRDGGAGQIQTRSVARRTRGPERATCHLGCILWSHNRLGGKYFGGLGWCSHSRSLGRLGSVFWRTARASRFGQCGWAHCKSFVRPTWSRASGRRGSLIICPLMPRSAWSSDIQKRTSANPGTRGQFGVASISRPTEAQARQCPLQSQRSQTQLPPRSHY